MSLDAAYRWMIVFTFIVSVMYGVAAAFWPSVDVLVWLIVLTIIYVVHVRSYRNLQRKPPEKEWDRELDKPLPERW